MISKLSRAKGAMAGLAIGDALGRPVEGLSPAQIRSKYGGVEDFLSQNPGGSDDTEYAILTGRALVKFGKSITSEEFASYWVEKVCNQTEDFLGAGFSEMAAISNLKAGLKPPHSGRHIHAWSDGLAMRVAPIGIVANGDMELAKRLAIADGQVSHSGEGIHSGVVVATAISQAMVGDSIKDLIIASKKSIPENSWTFRAITKALSVIEGQRDKDALSLTDHLLENVATHHYFYADIAPEAVSLAIASVVYGDGDFVSTVRFAVNCGRDADTIAAMAGAIVGAYVGFDAIPEHWRSAVTEVKGSCLAFTKGMSPIGLAEELIQL